MTVEDGKIDSVETFLRKSVVDLLLIVSQSLPFIGVSPYEAPTVIHLLSDQLMEKLRANLLELDLVRGNLISDATDNQLAIMTKQLAILHKKDAQALEAVKNHIRSKYNTYKWTFGITDYSDGEYGESWTVESTPDAPSNADTEEYNVFQALDGKWIVEEI